MEQRALSLTGLTVSALGFGCGSVGGLMVRGTAAEQRRAVARALEAGVTYFDTAPSYGDGRSEENLGRVLGELRAWDRVVVGTKVRLAPEDAPDAAAAIRRSLERSLRLLGRDRVDLLQLHNRITTGDARAGGLDADTVLGDVAKGMREVVAAGLVRHAGITGLGEADAVARVIDAGAFATMQAYFNAVNPSMGFPGAAGGAQDFGGLIDRARDAGLGVLAIRVLAAGALSGSDARAPNASATGGGALAGGGDFGSDLARAQRLGEIAADFALESTVELAVRFALAKTGVSTVLVGYSDLAQLETALRFAVRGPLSGDAVQRVVAVATDAN